jgi:dTDP-glucose 4,6-dehydratase
MATVLITGGAGFIGANFVHYWVNQYPNDQIVVLDALTYAGNLANLSSIAQAPNYKFFHGNICDESLVANILLEEKIDTIVHFAAESHVDRSILGPAAFVETNVVGTHTLLHAARAAWLDRDGAPSTHRFHHVSTDEVYGALGLSDPAFSEKTAYSPNSPYAASKAASDHLVRAYHHTYGLQVTTSNCSNNYGPYQFPEKLIPLMIVNALDGKPLPVYGDGSNIRDWLHVDDHVRGIDLILKNGIVGETYNIGGNEERANIDLVKAICAGIDRAFSRDTDLAIRFPLAPASNDHETVSLVTFVDDRLGHDWRYAIDASRIESELGYLPSHDLAGGIQKTIGWMLENERWWRDVMDGSYQNWILSQYSSE